MEATNVTTTPEAAKMSDSGPTADTSSSSEASSADTPASVAPPAAQAARRQDCSSMLIEILDTEEEEGSDSEADGNETNKAEEHSPAVVVVTAATAAKTSSPSTSAITAATTITPVSTANGKRERKRPYRLADVIAYDAENNSESTDQLFGETPKKRRTKKPDTKEKNKSMTENTDIPIGMKIQKKFDDGCYYQGTVVSGPEEVAKKEHNRTFMVQAWRVRYEDDDEEDLQKDELLKWAVKSLHAETGKKETPPVSVSASVSVSVSKPPTQTNVRMEYEKAKRDLCYKVGVSEEEVVAALNQMTPPYGLNTAMQLIHQAKLVQTAAANENGGILEGGGGGLGGKFVPKIGTRIRKLFMGAAYHGTITGDAELLDVPAEEAGEDFPKKVLMWEVTFDDGDKEDMDFNELLLCRANRPLRNNPVRGRQLCALELFGGCAILSQEFAQRLWRVRSIDTEAKSNATDIIDIMKLQYKDIGMVPDFIWASPPCFTYSNMAGGRHRSPDKEEYEKTPEAHENNRYLAQTAAIIRWAKSINPHLIVCIENPVGLLHKMPLMKELVRSLGLYSTMVNYCCFGRDDKKPTYLWTNDFHLYATLSEFKCPKRCPFKGDIHPIGARQHGYLYNAASIPQPLAEEVAEHVNSTFYMRRIRHTPENTLSQKEVEEFNKRMSDTAGV